jgi:hypothetical protein
VSITGKAADILGKAADILGKAADKVTDKITLGEKGFIDVLLRVFGTRER